MTSVSERAPAYAASQANLGRLITALHHSARVSRPRPGGLPAAGRSQHPVRESRAGIQFRPCPAERKSIPSGSGQASEHISQFSIWIARICASSWGQHAVDKIADLLRTRPQRAHWSCAGSRARATHQRWQAKGPFPGCDFEQTAGTVGIRRHDSRQPADLHQQ